MNDPELLMDEEKELDEADEQEQSEPITIGDMTAIETSRSKNGWQLLCIECGAWVNCLLNMENGSAVCAKCHKAQLKVKEED